jgi:NADPH:quinone reductase-like Zn-dependent oxidoreductase
MRAIVYRDFGTPDVLKVEEVAKPVPADDEILLAVRAAAVNTFDWYMVRGRPTFFRLLLGSGQKPLGVDLAGEVETVGRNVTRFKPGDRVFGTGRDKMRAKRGSFAGLDRHVVLVGVPCRRLLKSSHKPMVSSNKKIGPP